MKFNASQMEFIQHNGSPALIVASAGSGKSTVLVGKTVYLCKILGIKEEDILITTFTRNSANDLKRKLKNNGIKNVTTGTFHSVCKDICEKNGINVINQLKPYEIYNLFSKIVYSTDIPMVQDIIGWISYQKNYDIPYTSEEFMKKDTDYTLEELQQCYKAYEELKSEKGCYDFDDMLLLARDILIKDTEGKFKYKVLMVDEAQDSNMLQWQLTDLLCSTNDIYVVGDVKQSLYGFRGSVPKEFISFGKTHDAKVIYMNDNYRSDREIIKQANNFSRVYFGKSPIYSDTISNSNDEGLVFKRKFRTSEDESKYVVDKIEELLNKGYEYKDFFILYRNNNQAFDVESELRNREIPCVSKENGGFFKLKPIEFILSMIRLGINEEDDSAFESLIQSRMCFFKYISNAIINDIRMTARENGISLYEASFKVDYPQQYQRNAFIDFHVTISKVREGIDFGDMSTSQLISLIVNESKLINDIKKSANSEEEYEMKRDAIGKINMFVKDRNVYEFIDFAYSTGDMIGKKKKKSSNAVQLMTIHSSKGLENECVFVIGNNADVFPSPYSDIEEEACVFYVAITRAINQVYVTCNDKPSEFYRLYNEDSDKEVEEQPKPVKSRLAELLKNNQK